MKTFLKLILAIILVVGGLVSWGVYENFTKYDPHPFQGTAKPFTAEQMNDAFQQGEQDQEQNHGDVVVTTDVKIALTEIDQYEANIIGVHPPRVPNVEDIVRNGGEDAYFKDRCDNMTLLLVDPDEGTKDTAQWLADHHYTSMLDEFMAVMIIHSRNYTSTHTRQEYENTCVQQYEDFYHKLLPLDQ